MVNKVFHEAILGKCEQTSLQMENKSLLVFRLSDFFELKTFKKKIQVEKIVAVADSQFRL